MCRRDQYWRDCWWKSRPSYVRNTGKLLSDWRNGGQSAAGSARRGLAGLSVGRQAGPGPGNRTDRAKGDRATGLRGQSSFLNPFCYRLPRIVAPRVPLHIVQRGSNRQPELFSDGSYARYLEALQEGASCSGCAVHAYVMMTNHVHLIGYAVRRDLTGAYDAGDRAAICSVARRHSGYQCLTMISS